MLEIRMGLLYAADDFFVEKAAPLLNESESNETRSGRTRVLVVDDQKLIADTLTEILEGAGFHAMAAYDGWTALEVAARFQPDCLLSDVLMPQMNGVQLAIAVRRNYPLARIVLFSGQAGIAEIIQEGQQQGFDFELIGKPLHPLKLIERLKDKK